MLDYVDSVKKEGTTPVFGTVIAPADYVDAAGVFTMAALENASLDAAADKRYVNIVAKNGIETDTDGNITLSAALIDIHESNYTRNFAAVAYVSYETENGTMIIYGDYDDSKSSRNIREVAYSALEDVSETAVEGYQTAVTEWYAYEESAWVKKTGTAYSCYSKAQLEVIKAYIA